MITTFRKLFALLDQKEKRQFWQLAALLVLVAVVEFIGMSVVFVLLNVLSDPTEISNNRMLSWANDFLGFDSTFSFQIALASVTLAVVVGGLLVKAAGAYATVRFADLRGHSISTRLLRSYLSKPYVWFLEHNSAEIGKNVLSEVDGLIGRAVIPALRIFAAFFLVLSLLGFLLLVDPLVTLLSGGILGLSYAFTYVVLRGPMHRAGNELMKAYGARFVVTQEVTGGIKDVKLLGIEDTYAEVYSGAALRAARAGATMKIVADLPRFALEAITFGTLLALILVMLLRNDGDIAQAVPTLGIIAFATMRLLPALQQIYHGLASLRGASSILEVIAADIVPDPADQTARQAPVRPMPLKEQLELSGLGFAYASANRAAIHDVNLVIPARTTVGIVGGTGAGKTTLVDLILGLLKPETGTLSVDGVAITPDNVRDWQASIGYVPQAIFLTDDTIAANIAFGVPKDQIDMQAVERAARTAALHDFVTGELSGGYDSMVGERGVRLSGGQRQRIGIARALYRDPALLVMDEATSALDNITEREVMEAVQRIRGDKTVILIAHRLTTVRPCDCILLLERGRLVAKGSYAELLTGNQRFREMAAGGEETTDTAA